MSGDAATLVGFLSRSRGEAVCIIKGDSMRPALPDGSQVRLQPVRTLAVGGVAAFLMHGSVLTVHRIRGVVATGRGAGWCITAGDGTPICDAPMRSDAIIAVATGWRYSGAGPDSPWHPIAPVSPSSAAGRPLARTFTRVVSQLLGISPALAIAVRNLALLSRMPVVWLRPYPEDAERIASHLLPLAGGEHAAPPRDGA